MRIGVDVRELRRNIQTGIGRVLEAFLTETLALRPDLELVLYGDAETRTDLRGERRRMRVLSQPTTLWFDQLALPRALAQDGIHVFFSPYYKAPLFAPCPVVVTIHDLLFLQVGNWKLSHVLFKPWARLIASRATAVLTDSRQSRDDIERILGIAAPRLEVIPLGVSTGFKPEAREDCPAVLERLGIPPDYVLQVTNFHPHKNDLFLVKVFARLAPSFPHLSLVLAGRPAGSNRDLLALIEERGLEDRVHLTGHVAEKHLRALYAGAHLFAFPSLYEGFGLPVLEAMASGTPVVCSSSSSLPEVAGDAAILADPKDEEAWFASLGRALSDAPLRDRLRQAGLARAREFSWRASVARVLPVLERAWLS
jgi:glycosyltransferase involved in cell wall biosynthesis